MIQYKEPDNGDSKAAVQANVEAPFFWNDSSSGNREDIWRKR